ncbi:MAG TPA: hypothetical protein PLV42_11345 [bacterium]|nr:hypothetical protein [bacterium]
MVSRFLMLCGVLMLCTGALSAQEGAIVTPEGEVINEQPVDQPESPQEAPVEEKKKDDAPIQLPAKWSGARAEQFGLGFLLGEPTGISFRWFFHETQGIDALAAWGWGWDHHQKIVLHADYLFRFYDLIPIPAGDTALYVGGGLQMGMFDNRRYDAYYHTDHDWWFLLALRLPGGILYQVKSFPIEVLFEIAFLLNILPDLAPDFNVGLGLRFCF